MKEWAGVEVRAERQPRMGALHLGSLLSADTLETEMNKEMFDRGLAIRKKVLGA